MNIKVFEKIREVSSTLEKERIATDEFNIEHHTYLENCFNDIVYGISVAGIAKAIGYNKKKHGNFEDLGYFLEQYPNTISKSLIEEEITLSQFVKRMAQYSGNRQIEELRSMLSNIRSELRPWYVRILLKNPKLGFNLTSYNKVRKNIGVHVIEKFFVKLAESSTKKKFQDILYPAIVEIKFDGERCIATYNINGIKLTSRRGKDITSQFPEIVQQMKEMFDNNKMVDSIKIDGEIISTSFNSLQKRLGRKEENIETDDDIKLKIFDIVEINNKFVGKENQTERMKILDKFVPNEYLSKRTIVMNKIEMNKFFQEALSNNEEGIMLKEFEAKWQDNRKGWWKVKDVLEYDLEVIDYAYGEGANCDKVARLKVASKCRKIQCWVGSGLKDEHREWLTNNQDTIRGMIVEIHYSELLSKDDDTYSLRFPRFIRFREDKTEANNK